MSVIGPHIPLIHTVVHTDKSHSQLLFFRTPNSIENMRLSFLIFFALASFSAVSTAPSIEESASYFVPSEVGFAAPLSLWLSRVMQPFISFSNLKSDLSSSLSGDRLFDSLRSPDYSSKSIWEVIQTDEHLGDLKRVLKYSSSATRELLDDKEKKLTFLGR